MSKFKTPKGTKPSKYKAKKVTRIINGVEVEFDSKKEAERYDVLHQMELEGRITALELRKPFELIPSQRRGDGKAERACKYIADFCYYDCATNRVIVEDVKGYRNSVAYSLYSIKRKLLLEKYGISIVEI